MTALFSSDLFSDMAMEIIPLEETGSHDLNSPDGSFENMALDEELSLDETLTLADVPDELLTDAFDLASEEIDETSLIEEFVVEAREHLQQSDAALLAILEGDDSKGLVDDTFRSIHTIKGSAEYLGLEKASQLLHKMESLLDLIRQGDRKADRHTVVSLLNAKDTVQQLVEASMDEQALHGIDITAALERLDAVEPPADEIESQTDNSSADDALEGGRQWRLEIEDDSVAELMDDFHEDYDEELFSIFLEQFETHIDSIDQALADYSADQSIDHVLSLVLESIRHLKNSANYMGYDRLCSLYDQQSDNIHAFLSSDVLLEGTAGLEFFESAIHPWALKIRSLLHPEVLLRPSEADAASIDEVTAQTYDLDSFKENADGPDGSVDPDEPDGVEDPGMPYMDSTETAHSIKMKLSGAVDLSPEEQDLFRLLESAFNSSMPGAAESVPVRDQGVLGSELFSSDLPQEINGDEDVTEKVYDDTDHSSVTEESGLLNDILSAIADGTSFDSPLKTLSDLLPTDVECDFAVEDPEDVPAVEEAALQTIEDIFSSQPLPIVDLIPDKPVETPAVVERTAKHNIRVDAAKIDLLMNQVGELVVNRSVFTQLANDLRLLEQYFKQDLDLNKKELKPMQELALRLGDATVSLGRVANDLQEGVMKVRMLPISQLFNRYPRLVHDLTRKSGKKVHLDIKGADTELDRMVIEEISDPLVHIIRNAVDHGIETTQERIDAGKTESGTISLTAYHESNNVVIEISDDGKGLDIEKIRNRGIENGLIPEGAVGLPMGTLVDLIAQPGFSTADTITHTSGRGVGMDVVKKNIEKLNGNLEIDSRPGKGTKIRIKIPLTLAIFSALLVRVEDELYTVPLASVEETLRIQEEEINVVEGVEVIHLRDEPVPLLPLPKLFNKRETLTNESGKMYAVIVNNGKMRVGLIVDSLLGQEEVVIKPLEDYLQENSGFSGATILGDGQISLILDVYELVKITMDRKDKIAAETLI